MPGIWGDGQRGGIFGAKVDPRLQAELERRAAAKRQEMAPGFLDQWHNSLANRILSAPSKLFGGLVVDPAIDAMTLAGDVYAGRQPTMAFDPQTGETGTDPGLLGRANNAASMLAGGGVATAGAKPAGSLGTFGGPLAKTADLAALKRAEELKAAGATRDQIWQETGWDVHAVDKQPKFEISDEAARFVPPTNVQPHRLELAQQRFEEQTGEPRIRFATPKWRDASTEALHWVDANMERLRAEAPKAKLKDVLVHPELYAAHPELGNVETMPENFRGGGTKGSFSGRVGDADNPPLITYGGSERIFHPEDNRSTLLHEGMHGVQDIEGFGRGANTTGLRPGTPAWQIYQERLKAIRKPMPREEFDARFADPQSLYTYEKYLKEHKAGLRKNAQMLDRAAQETAVQEAYRRASGEVEARNVQKRMNMTAEERRATPPWKTQDVPDEQQIVRFRGLGDQLQESRTLKQETPFSGIKRDIPIEKTTATYTKGQKLLPEKPFDITQVPEGSHFVSTFGDRSDIGKRLTGIGGEKFQEPVDLYGGAGFMRRANNPDEAGWASGKSVITKLQNAVRPLQETGKPVYLIHTGMGQRAVDFSSMMIKTLQQQIKNKPLSKAAVKAFDKRMKVQWGKDHPALPDWPGWDNVDINNLSGPERLKAVKLMDTDDMRKLGFPDVGAARWAITDPKQRNMPFLGTGSSVFELGGPIEHNVNPKVGHPDYPSQATSPRGKYVGTTPEIIHGLEFFVDVKKGLKPGTTNESHIGRKFLMSPAIQRVSPEWLQHIINHLKSDRGQKLGIAGAIGAGLLTAEQAQEMFGAKGGEEPGKT